ncbi:unnamed protein product [Closterium sp. Yama58-4]|nr:unnamed protein product [Closterium sp. Yama58-4]
MTSLAKRRPAATTQRAKPTAGVAAVREAAARELQDNEQGADEGKNVQTLLRTREGEEETVREAGGARVQEGETKLVDVVTLGNLCVDVLVAVDQLPPSDRRGKWEFLQRVKANPPDESCWEAGGNLNFGIAAARLGLRCTAFGHVAGDAFGAFLARVMADERVALLPLADHVDGPLGDGPWEGAEGEREGEGEGEGDVVERSEGRYDGETLACWVFLDKNGRHAFASRFDFNKNPAFSRVQTIPPAFAHLIARSRALFINGFAFDEFPPSAIQSAAQYAQQAGVLVFFDPGPRTGTLFRSAGQSKEVFDWLLLNCDVLLLTSEEAEVVTQQQDPNASAEQLLELKARARAAAAASSTAAGGSGLSAGAEEREAGGGVDGLTWTHQQQQQQQQQRRQQQQRLREEQQWEEEERPQWVAVKKGPNGCVLATAAQGVFSLPGFKVDVADTVGCGDSFAAAVAMGLLSDEGPSTTLALANAVGAATAMGSGAGRNVARAARVAEILLGLQAKEEGWHGAEEDWDADVWLEDKGKRFRVGHVAVHGASTCPSGTPLLQAVRDAESLLHRSLLQAQMNCRVMDGAGEASGED